MNKNVVYMGEFGLFSETIKKVIETEGGQVFDFPSWEECKGQIQDLNPGFLMIDLDSIDITSIGDEGKQIKTVFFSEKEIHEIKWGDIHYFQLKPVEVIKFKDFIRKIFGKENG